MAHAPMQPQLNRFTPWQVATAIFVIAFGLRLLFLFSAGDAKGPHSKWYEGDAPIWVEWASALDRKEAFQFNLPIHPPGVAYPLAYFYQDVRESGFTAMKVMWCAMSAAACTLLCLCCLPFGTRVALISAGLCTCSFGQYVLATSLNSEAPYTFLLCAVALLTQWVCEPRSLWWAAALGVAHGFANLLRPEHTLLVILWIVLMLAPALLTRKTSRSLSQTFITTAIMLIAFVLTCLPWTVQASRNVRIFNEVGPREPEFEKAPIPWTAPAQARLRQLPPVTQAESLGFITYMAARDGLTQVDASDIDRILLREFGTIPQPLSRWVLVSNQGGMSFALANDVRSDGGFSRALFEHPLIGRNPTFRFSFPPHLRLVNDGYAVGWSQIKSDPEAWLKLVIRKLQRFADGASQGFTAANFPLGRHGVREPIDMFTARGVIEPFWQTAMIATFVIGAFVAFMRRMAGVWLVIIAYKLVVTILFYGYARQAASIAPAFFVITALAVDWVMLKFAPNIKPRQTAKWMIAGVALLMLVAAEIYAAITVDHFTARGNLNPKPEWGDNAFHSFERVDIQRSPLE
jgi:hypothetical protein